MIEFSNIEDRLNFMKKIISEGCPIIMAVLNDWETHGVYCLGYENLSNTQCSIIAPELINYNFYPRLHGCQFSRDHMRFIKLIATEKHVQVIPITKELTRYSSNYGERK